MGIVTGEGVVLESEPGTVLTRILSGLIDYTVYGLALTFAMLFAAWVSMFDATGMGGAISLVVVLITLVGVPIAVEALSHGRSLGRLALGIRIVRDDGGVISVRHAVIRGLTAVVEIWLSMGLLAVVSSLFNAKGKRLGDLLAGTYAVRTRGGPRDRVKIEMPYHLAGWAQSADVSRLPDHLGLATRQFLGRADKMHGQSRERLGTELTEQVQKYVRPLPPPGTHPEYFLAAVLAERRTREARAEAERRVRTRAEAEVMDRLPFGVADDYVPTM